MHGLEAKVKAGSAKAKYDLAKLYSKYDGNFKKSYELMTQSANQGYDNAERDMLKSALRNSEYNMKQIEDECREHNKDKECVGKAYQEVMKWADKLLVKKDAEAAYLLGKAYSSGLDGLPKNYNKAKEMYEKAVSFGSLYAIAKLANCYKSGLGVDKNIPKAISLYEKAGQKGDSRGYGGLAYMYEKGDGVPKDEKKAKEYKIKEDKVWKCEITPSSCQGLNK